MTVDKAADAAAAVSIPSAVMTFIVDAMPLLQFVAVIVAIVAGAFAIAVHLKNLRK